MREKDIDIEFHKKIIPLLTFALILTGVISCAQIEQARDKAAIKDTVISYNKGLIVAAKTGDVKPMAGIASKELLAKLFWWRAAYEDTNAYMDGTLNNINFRDIALAGQTAHVLTAEDWAYVYRNIKTKKIVLPETGRHYEMEYVLRKKNGKWIITDIRIKSEKKEDDK